MNSRYEHNGLTWVDLENPTRDEVVNLAVEFSIDAAIAEELLQPSAKPRAEFGPAYAYVVMHFPALRHSHKTREQEIDFIVGTDFIITAHYEPIDSIHKFSKVFEVNAVLNKSSIGDHAGFLLFYMLKKMYRAVEHELEYIRNDLRLIEEHVFSGHEVSMVAAISRSARDLLNLRQTIEPHRDMLQELEAQGPTFWGDDFRQYLRLLSNEYYRVHNHVMRSTESLHELRETNNSLLSTKQNETMRTLTLMALFTFPLALLVSILGLDFAHNPIRGMVGDFWVVVAAVAAGATFMYIVFKRNGWL